MDVVVFFCDRCTMGEVLGLLYSQRRRKAAAPKINDLVMFTEGILAPVLRCTHTLNGTKYHQVSLWYQRIKDISGFRKQGESGDHTLHKLKSGRGSRRMHALMNISPPLKTIERHLAAQIACNPVQLVQQLFKLEYSNDRSRVEQVI